MLHRITSVLKHIVLLQRSEGLVCHGRLFWEGRDDMNQALLDVFEKEMKKGDNSYIATWDEDVKSLVELYKELIEDEPLEEQIVKLLRLAYGDSFLNTGIYNAFKAGDMQLLHDTMYQASGMKQICNIANPGVDHAYYSYNIMPELLCACRTDRIEFLLPAKNGLCYGKMSGAGIINLFMSLWYQDEQFAKEAKKLVEEGARTKRKQLDGAYIDYLCALLDKDTDKAGEKLSLMCKVVRKAKGVEFSEFKKKFFILAHAMFNLSQFVYGGELAGEVAMPDEDNFSKEFAQWQKQNGFKPGKSAYIFPEPLGLYNVLLDITPPQMHLFERHKRMFIDTDRFRQELIIKVKQRLDG